MKIVMKIVKISVKILVVAVVGTIITGIIDSYLGVNLENIGLAARMTHHIAYMMWGAVALAVT